MPPSSVDIGPGRLFHENNDIVFQQPKYSRTLIKCLIFTVIFVLSAIASLTYTFMRPAIYESRAELLLTPDLAGSNGNMEGGTAIQDVAVQNQVLLSRDLLTQLLGKLSENRGITETIPSNLSDLKNMVRVTSVENSTIVNLRAEGPEKNILPVIVNTWVDLYLEKNSQMQTTKSNAAWESLQQQIHELENKLTEKQVELNKFRDKYDIVSMQRDENQILSELKGLNKALNNTVEEKVAAEANLIAIKEAIEQEKWAGRFRKPTELTRLEEQAEILKEIVTEYQARYTPKYLQLDKDARIANERLERLEEKILLKYEENRISAIEEAEQEIVSAGHAIAVLENKLAVNKKKAAMFSKRFSEHEFLQEELAQLESFSRDKKEARGTTNERADEEARQVKCGDARSDREYLVRYRRETGDEHNPYAVVVKPESRFFERTPVMRLAQPGLDCLEHAPANRVATKAAQHGKHRSDQRVANPLLPIRQAHRGQHDIDGNREERGLGKTHRAEIAFRVGVTRPGKHLVVQRPK